MAGPDCRWYMPCTGGAHEVRDDWYRANHCFRISIMNKRLHIYCSGSVQGVGFRFLAQSAAHQLGVTGWVKNLEDGRVEVVCEGEGASLNKFLEKIKDAFGEYIRDFNTQPQDATGEFKGFDVKF